MLQEFQGLVSPSTTDDKVCLICHEYSGLTWAPELDAWLCLGCQERAREFVTLGDEAAEVAGA